MKRVMLSGLVMLFSIGMMAQSTNDKLPKTAQDFISKHFSNLQTEEVKENSSWEIWEDEKYEVRLSNGLQLDFDENGNIIEIDSQNNEAIPEAAIPASITTYLKSNHPDAKIIGWEKQGKGQEVELSNGIEVEFDNNGKFLKID
ncbi:PepSY-like domain-containing protein [Antarcticibacterium sp. 1MA-6-2]|uniref:PepSY-like domain-containing protein n=1 Tax=Antarcticibacterium sp. 1MA-6-2 TaxID=2908210 RepID=UPI001F1BD399|nr:PepSY-like domain-containing protein [Antarcticibacterium sp. 1MA-6-2]UJH92894.1 PepSY-like domain-containing protein [Antarcticibacterium sp. 1MA-6-2]